MEKSKRPLAIFALDPAKNYESLPRLCDMQGLDSLFVRDTAELLSRIHDSRCFAIFLDHKRYPTAGELIEMERKTMRAFWIVLSAEVNSTQYAGLISKGAYAVITREVKPEQLALRARLILESFTRLYPDFFGAPLREISMPNMSYDDLLQLVVNQVVMVNAQHTWNPAHWPIEDLPQGSLPDESLDDFGGSAESKHSLSHFFSKCCDSLRAQRITFVSFRKKMGEVPDENTANAPDTVHAVVSNDPRTEGRPLLTNFLPHIQLAFSQQKPLFLDGPLPISVDHKLRPPQWCIEGRSEQASLVIPLVMGSTVYGALIIQFADSLTRNQKTLIEEAASFLKLPQKDYVRLEFLDRVYRNMPKN